MQIDHDKRPDGARLGLVSLATVALLVARIPVLSHRSLDPDELEHSHAAWCMFKGMLPYKDFFEHHTPWYYYLLQPLFKWFDVDASFDSARGFLLCGRGLSLALTALSIVLLSRIGRLWAGRRVGVVAAFFLLGQPVFLQKTIEMRPDVLALPFFLTGLWLLLRGLDARGDSHPRRLGWFVGGGFAVGGAVMCTQKALFVLPGLLAGLALWALSARRRARVLLVAAFLLAAALPGALTWGGFALNHAGRGFIHNNFLLNAGWKHTPTGQLLKLLETSAPILALALWGLYEAARRWFRSGRNDGEGLLVCTVVGLFAGLPVIPVAHRQYYLLPLPIVCLFAARALFSLLDRARERTRPRLLVLAIASLSVLPVVGLRGAFGDRNDLQLAQLREVFERTGPTDLVMDGWLGMGVFRPHAFHYFFLHEETRAMLPAPQWSAYLDALEAGRIRPKLIAMDENLAAMGPRFLTFVHGRYASRDGVLYFAAEPR
jgi:uncharacterized membrane protein